jgi:hypothetical protein
MNYPVWSCSKEGGIYIVHAMVRDEMFRYDVRHAISKTEFDNAWCKKALLEIGIEGMMSEFKKMAFKNIRSNRSLGWPKQKYDTNQLLNRKY